MIIGLRFLLPTIFCAVMMVSCGKAGDDHYAATPATTVPQTDNDSEETNSNRSYRYESIVLEENCGFWTDCDFTIRADFNRRPVILMAKFVDNGFPDEDSIDEGTCNFHVTLSEKLSDQLEALANKLRFCEVENIPTADGGFDGLFSTEISGRKSMVYKYKNRGQEEEGKISYICAGRAGYYNYMRKIILSTAPDHCPSGYKRLFR